MSTEERSGFVTWEGLEDVVIRIVTERTRKALMETIDSFSPIIIADNIRRPGGTPNSSELIDDYIKSNRVIETDHSDGKRKSTASGGQLTPQP